MKGKNFVWKSSGRCGNITYHEDENSIKIPWEMSGDPQYHILLTPVDLRVWDAPEGIMLPEHKQIELLQELRSWVKGKKIKTDIDLPDGLTVEDARCTWTGCEEKRLKSFMYCKKHYDQSLLKK